MESIRDAQATNWANGESPSLRRLVIINGNGNGNDLVGTNICRKNSPQFGFAF